MDLRAAGAAQERRLDSSGIPILALAERRLTWAEQREAVLAQNVANANTPGWRARDVAPFAQALHGLGVTMPMARTQGAHLSGVVPAGLSLAAAGEPERSPDGNSVALDRELTKLADTDAVHEFAADVLLKYRAMFRMALGR